MNWEFHLIFSVACIISSIFVSSSVGELLGQGLLGPKVKQASTVEDIFKAGITLFGINKETGNVFSFVKVNDATLGRFFNASKEDLKDNDGIVDLVIAFPNETVAPGANFTACNLVLKDFSMSCKPGFNAPGRIDIIQIALSSVKGNVK